MVRYIIFFFIILFGESVKSQFLDFNLFKPRLVIGGEYLHATQDSSLGNWKTDFNYLFPIKSKLDFKVDWEEALFSKSIKDAIGSVQPRAYQLFGNIGASYQDFSFPKNFGAVQKIKAGISGIHVTYKKKKIRSLVFGAAVNVTQSINHYKNPGINPSAFLGRAFAGNLRSFWVIGGYASFFGNRFLGSPVIVYYQKINKHWSTLFVLPVQGKLSWKKNNRFEQSIALSYFGENFMLNNFNNPSADGVYYTSGFRLSTQSKIKFGKKNFIYLEMGWQNFSKTGKINGYYANNITNYSGSLFSKIRVVIPVNRSLLNSDVFDFGL